MPYKTKLSYNAEKQKVLEAGKLDTVIKMTHKKKRVNIMLRIMS